MEVIFESLVNTGWGAVLLGTLILTAIVIEFFNNKPKI